MADKIDSDKLLVKDVFTKWYRIPEYQRPYVWGNDQVSELLDDVFQAKTSNPENQYFLGSMVLKKNLNSSYEEFDILDGQQRLTTLFIISAVIRDMSKNLTIPEDEKKTLIQTAEESIYQKRNDFKNIPERVRIIFDIRDQVKLFVEENLIKVGGTDNLDFFKQQLIEKNIDISIKNMSKTVLIIREYFDQNNNIPDFYQYLQTKVLMIYVATEQLEDAFHLFTVMNNRGIKLRNSDILKAENLAKVPDANQRTKYAKKWEEIEEYFGEDFDNFLSHLRAILVKTKAGYNLLKEYEDNIYNPTEFDRNTKKRINKTPLLERGIKTFDFIEKYNRYYQELFELDNHSLTNNFEFFNLLTVMRIGFEADFWIATLLRFYDKYQKNKLLEFTKALNNKFSADWITGLSPTNRIENNNAIINAIDISSSVDDVFLSSSLIIKKEDVLRILCSNVYGRRYARYLLLKLDNEYLAATNKISIPETISIEHILPQTPEVNSTWANDFNDSKREFWTNKLGNLVIISRKKNSSQSNYDFDKKKDKYFRNNIELFANSVRVLTQYKEWKENDIKLNHKEVVLKLASCYGFNISDEEYKIFSGLT